jgi:hypothetical protein
MKRYYGNQAVDPGIYFCPKDFAFKSMDDSGRLPGTGDELYWRVPALAMLAVAPVIGLLYVIFLPLVGFVMLGAVVFEKLAAVAREGAARAVPLLRPAWQPARAFLARGKARKPEEKAAAREPEADAWAETVREELEKEEEAR